MEVVDRLILNYIEAKAAEDLLSQGDVSLLKEALVRRVKCQVLDVIKADEVTPWTIVKERLEKGLWGR